jgi:2-polyprenyl-3-methyl-5-hydroxy-6-metoxy-1,4-benzoquinol methylase
MHAALLPVSGEALDLACGSGRHALWLAARALSVTAIDADPDALETLALEAASRGLPVTVRLQDLEADAASLGTAAFDVIVGVHYLHRPLFPAIREALRPGGLLIYETFTQAQAALGKPTNPAFLLEPGELRRLVDPLEIVDQREGFFENRHVASMVARKTVVI